MKFLRGSNWFEIQFGRKLRKGFYSGPLYGVEKCNKGNQGSPHRLHLYSFMTRRLKIKLLRDRETKQWEFSFGGFWCSNGSINQYMNYSIQQSKFLDEEQ